MGHMVYVLASVARVHPDHFCSRGGFEFLRSRRSDENLRSRDQTREVDKVAQRSNLRNGLDGTFSKDGKETLIC